jgi:hypothetical protein
LMATTYFHCAAVPLGRGSVICPGNWGRIIRLYGPNDGTFRIAFREWVMENVRVTEYPQKPSRLHSSFVLLNLEEAKFFRDSFQQYSIIYEVEPLSEPPSTHIGDYTTLGVNDLPNYFDKLKELAQNYWSQSAKEHRELLLSVPIRIVRCVDERVPDMPGLKD